MATRDTRRRLAPPAPVPGHTLDPSSGDAMPRTVPSLASLGAVSAGIPKEATARPHKGQERHSSLSLIVICMVLIFAILHLFFFLFVMHCMLRTALVAK